MEVGVVVVVHLDNNNVALIIFYFWNSSWARTWPGSVQRPELDNCVYHTKATIIEHVTGCFWVSPTHFIMSFEQCIMSILVVDPSLPGTTHSAPRPKHHNSNLLSTIISPSAIGVWRKTSGTEEHWPSQSSTEMLSHFNEVAVALLRVYV